MKRKSRASIAIAFIAALSATVPTETVAAPAWQPAGGWTIRQDDHCVAELRFAHKSQQLQFAIEPGPTSPSNFAYLVTEGDGEFGWTKADIAIGTKWKAGQTIHVMPSKLPHHIAYKWGLSDEQLGALERFLCVLILL